MKPLLKIGIVSAVMATASISPVFSQETTEKSTNRTLSVGIGLPDSTKEFHGQIGVGLGVFPEYEGSDDYAATGLPLADIGKPGSYFLKGGSINTNDGLASAGVTIFHTSYTGESGQGVQFVLGPFVRFHGGRDQDAHEALAGLGDIDPSAGLGGFMELRAGAWLAHLSAAPHEVGNDEDGLLVSFDIKYTTSVSDKLAIATGLATSWANDEYMQGFFGVTDTQAARSGLARFDSEAGFKDVGLQLYTSYALSKQLTLDGQIGYWRLMNDAADSPIVDKEGSANQFRGLVGLSYRF